MPVRGEFVFMRLLAVDINPDGTASRAGKDLLSTAAFELRPLECYSGTCDTARAAVDPEPLARQSMISLKVQRPATVAGVCTGALAAPTGRVEHWRVRFDGSAAGH